MVGAGNVKASLLGVRRELGMSMNGLRVFNLELEWLVVFGGDYSRVGA